MDGNSRSHDHRSNYYTFLYITYLSLSVLPRNCVFQIYLTMWNFYWTSPQHQPWHFHCHWCQVICHPFYIAWQKMSKMIYLLFCLLKLRFRQRWDVLPRQCRLRGIHESVVIQLKSPNEFLTIPLETYPTWPPNSSLAFQNIFRRASIPRESCTCLNATDNWCF